MVRNIHLSANSNYETDITIEQISKYSGLSKGYVKDYFLPRLKKTDLVKIETYYDGPLRKRNNYMLQEPEERFFSISKQIITDTLNAAEKGLIIGLYSLCENNKHTCGLLDSVIISKLKLSRATYYRHKKSLFEKGYIIPFSNYEKDYTGLETADYTFSDLPAYSGLELMPQWLGYKGSHLPVFTGTSNYTNTSISAN